MSWKPINDLEAAFKIAHHGLKETVDYNRELSEGVLCFLMPYHPELEGLISVGNGSTMSFVFWMVSGENMIPVFTSPQRMEEALRATGKWEEKHSMGEMTGKELLHLVSVIPGQPKVAINPACGTGARVMDAEAIKGIVDGSALKLPTPGEQAFGKLIFPGYFRRPYVMLAALTNYFNSHPEVRAAWLWSDDELAEQDINEYVVALEVAPGYSPELAAEIQKLAEATCDQQQPCRVALLDPADEYSAELIASFPAFYKAAEYQGLNRQELFAPAPPKTP